MVGVGGVKEILGIGVTVGKEHIGISAVGAGIADADFAVFIHLLQRMGTAFAVVGGVVTAVSRR